MTLNLPALAERLPLPEEALRKQADAVVVGAIEGIRVEAGPAQHDKGLGNSDWAIHLTLRVETVESGDITNQQLRVECFRLRQRRSAWELITASGHHPIPPKGTRVRASLKNSGGHWQVVLPNGIVPLDDSTQDAPQDRSPTNDRSDTTLPPRSK